MAAPCRSAKAFAFANPCNHAQQPPGQKEAATTDARLIDKAGGVIGHESKSLVESLAHQRRAVLSACSTPDAMESMASFLQMRKPLFNQPEKMRRRRLKQGLYACG